ncbi:1-phosphofructokinase [Suicoccus acidiformans]|uniref:Tagatose-6-phosphate kinase n=1 Tax=Suicoccus acidiformans TaxID=2036206 RepID=A0A347WIS5_9LACT|nr:PfkB family carbohydrate kinase [Suicoccus acidiformans]AXY24982.1 1-phosphofructokinase [Suicoccus acidiformans]
MIHLICPNPALDRTLLLTDALMEGIPNRPYKVKEFPGGKSFNVAYALNHGVQHEKVLVHTILGGPTGQYVLSLAEDKGIDVKFIEVEKNTRECNIIVEMKSGNIYPIYEQGFVLTQNLLKNLTESIIESISPKDIIVFSGSLMQGMPDDYIVQISSEVKDLDVQVLVDTSGHALKEVYKKSRPTLLKINDEEFNELIEGNLSEPEEFIDFFKNHLSSNIENIVVTLGSKGAVAKIDKRYLYLKVPEIKAKNPVASGDFFLGGLVSGVSKQIDLVEALKLSIAYSISNCLYWFPNIEEEDVQEYKKQIELKEF